MKANYIIIWKEAIHKLKFIVSMCYIYFADLTKRTKKATSNSSTSTTYLEQYQSNYEVQFCRQISFNF